MKVQVKCCWLSLAVLAMLMLAGCGKNRDAQLVGQWKIDIESMNLSSNSANDVRAKQMAQTLQSLVKGMSLELKADKSFDMNMFMKMSGNWAIDEAASTLILTPTKIANVDISKTPGAGAGSRPITFQIASDSSHLTVQDSTGKVVSKGALSFIKASTP